MTENLDVLARARADLHDPERKALLVAIHGAVLAGMAATTVERREDLALAHPTITRNERGEMVAITLQDDEHRILANLWER